MEWLQRNSSGPIKTGFLFISTFFIAFLQFGVAGIQKTLYINRGVFTCVNGNTFPFLAFNDSAVYSSQNSVINIRTSDTLFIKVINNDTVLHRFSVDGCPSINALINPGDSLMDTLVPQGERLYIFYDHHLYPKNRYMGLGGMICVNNSTTAKKYYWNLKEHSKKISDTLSVGGQVNWRLYEPDYFTINGWSHPDLENDTTAKINVNLGDTVYIFVINTGQSAHALHFHGFHVKTLFSTRSYQIGWVKDSYPLHRMDGVVLELVPDKVGKYSVHDHNLVAVQGGGTHPNGMFTIMEIQ